MSERIVAGRALRQAFRPLRADGARKETQSLVHDSLVHDEALPVRRPILMDLNLDSIHIRSKSESPGRPRLVRTGSVFTTWSPRLTTTGAVVAERLDEPDRERGDVPQPVVVDPVTVVGGRVVGVVGAGEEVHHRDVLEVERRTDPDSGPSTNLPVALTSAVA